MTLRKLAQRINSLFALPVIGQLPALQILGALPDGPSLQAYLGALSNAAAPVVLPIRYSPVTNVSTTALTLNPANAAEGIVNAWVVMSGGSANTNTTDTATAILQKYWPNAVIGSTANVLLVNLNSGTTTLAGGTNVTISGTATIVTTAVGVFRAKVTNLAAPAGTLGNQTLQPGQATTNTTTTTAAVTNNAGQNNPTSTVSVAATTGVTANLSWVGLTNTDGTTSYYLVTAVNSLVLTLQGNINKNVANGAAVGVYNDTITITRLFVFTAAAV